MLVVNKINRKEGDIPVVNDISFIQERGHKLAISGETGSGKTSLLKMIAGLVQPSSGSILFEGEKVTGPNEQLIPGHPHIAYMSQYFELRNNYWVYEILEMANKLKEGDAEEIYAVCQVEHLLKRRTNQLSGGEKQRIALARLLTTRPQLLLLDEPFSNSDMLHKSVIKQVIHDIGEQLNISCIMVSHDPLDVLSWADTILVIRDGVKVQQGTPNEIYYRPVNEYCAGLFGDYNQVDPKKSLLIHASQRDKIKETFLCIRPEELLINAGSETSIRGIISKVLFWGSYYTIDIITEGRSYRAKTTDDCYKKGDVVSLSLSH